MNKLEKLGISYILAQLFPVRWKEWNELRFWKNLRDNPNRYVNEYYVDYFTICFDLEPGFYTGRKILDIGCGPLGSLEWADMAIERIGLDPLANEYLKLGAVNHKMKYISAAAEDMPFQDNYFDIVSSFNSLDHVANVDDTISEIKRVLKPGGIFLLITDVNHKPTPCEPQSFSWDIVQEFLPELEIMQQEHYEKNPQGLIWSLRDGIPYDHSNKIDRYGILLAKFHRKSR